MIAFEAEEMERQIQRTSQTLEEVAVEAAEQRVMAENELNTFEAWVSEAEEENAALREANQKLQEQRRCARNEERREAEVVRERRAATEEAMLELHDSRRRLELDNRRLCRDIEAARSVVRG